MQKMTAFLAHLTSIDWLSAPHHQHPLALALVIPNQQLAPTPEQTTTLALSHHCSERESGRRTSGRPGPVLTTADANGYCDSTSRGMVFSACSKASRDTLSEAVVPFFLASINTHRCTDHTDVLTTSPT